MLGGNRILLEDHVIRHMGDIVVIHAFDATETMQALIVGRDISGVGAFTYADHVAETASALPSRPRSISTLHG